MTGRIPRDRLLAAALLALFAVVTVGLAVAKSNVWDEPAHILSGYAYLADGNDWLTPRNHPILGKALGALLPYLLLDLQHDPTIKAEHEPGTGLFVAAPDFIYRNVVPGERILLLARLGNILLGLLLGWFVWRWSRALWGTAGGIVSLLLFVLCPNVLANASIATTDLPVTAFFLIGAYCCWRIAVDGGRATIVAGAGIAMGLALACKITAVLLLPVLAAACAVRIRRDGAGRAIAAGLLALLVAWACLWAVYGFRFHSAAAAYPGMPWERYADRWFTPLVDLARGARVLPESYLYGIVDSLGNAATGKPAFLMGERSMTGWWYYFAVAFLIKTPLPAILAIVAAAAIIAVRRERWFGGAFVLGPAVLVFAVVSAQNLNTGLRHVLPAFPLLHVAAGAVGPSLASAGRRWRLAAGGLAAWYVVAAAVTFPNQLAYFNELIGGPANGYRWLVDSNLDWGQDLKGLKAWMDGHGVGTIRLGYFGNSDPEYFGIEYDYLPSIRIAHPRPFSGETTLGGYVAVSATLLQGLYLPEGDVYRELRGRRPVATIGHTILVYRFAGDDDGS